MAPPDADAQALLVVAHLSSRRDLEHGRHPPGDTYRHLVTGFGISTATAYRYLREALELLAAMAPSLQQAIEVARGKAYVILDGTLLRIDRVAMSSGRDRPFYAAGTSAAG